MTPTNVPLYLFGAQEPYLTFIKGEIWGPMNMLQTFVGAVWSILPDGSWTFQPPVTAPVRDDLYPIAGSYVELANDTIELQGSMWSNLGASSSIDGTMHLNQSGARLDIIHSIAASSQRIVRVEQLLVPYVQSAAILPRVVRLSDAVVLPSAYAIELSGIVDGHQFGPLQGHLKLFSASGGDPNPFRIELSTIESSCVGSIFWDSYLHYSQQRGELRGRVLYSGGSQIILEAVDAPNPVSPTWFTNLILQYIGSLLQGVAGTRGQLSLILQDDTLSGTLELAGLSDLRQQSIYRGQLTGRRRGDAFLMKEGNA